MRIGAGWRVAPIRSILVASLALHGCATPKHALGPTLRPAEVRSLVVHLLPPATRDREGWATDITAAFAALSIQPTASHLCAAIAVTEQESTFVADPPVAKLGAIAREEIDRRAAQRDVPQILVRAALALSSSNGKSYAERIASVHSERELSLVYEDLIGRVPLGKRLFAEANPVHTGGPMQVGIAFAEQQARDHPYPYPIDGSIRHEVFTRRGGVYFGVAHLLDYPTSYDRMIFRFADFNAGRYASRNAAFQHAVSRASGIPLALDGDLVAHDRRDAGSTELAIRTLDRQLDIGNSRIRRALDQGEEADFAKTALYTDLFALADKVERAQLPRAIIPRIDLKSPKITRKLTTGWYANSVDQRYRRCLARAPST